MKIVATRRFRLLRSLSNKVKKSFFYMLREGESQTYRHGKGQSVVARTAGKVEGRIRC